MKICSEYLGITRGTGFDLVHTNCADIKVVFVTDEIARVRISFDREMADESYVLSTTAWDDRMDDFLAGDRTKVDPVNAEFVESEDELIWVTRAVKLVLSKKPLGFRLYDAEGTLLYSDREGQPYTLDANHRVNHYSRMQEDDCFYGFGEKAGELNKNKHFMRQRATDAMGYDAQRMDTLYKHIPFYIRMPRDTKKAVGVYYNNFYESVFNMGCEKSNYWPRYTYFQADGGDLDIFFLAGNTIKKVVDNYTLLTGRPALLPKRALGYQGSSMFYPELEKDSDDAVLGFIDTIKEEGFPIDGFHLSSGYTSYDNKRCVFTWNTTRFKDPRAYFAAMNEKGAQNVPNIKPGILLEHPYYKDFEAADAFVKDSEDDTKPAEGMWWGGVGSFFDFTSPTGREVWKKYLTDNIIDVGTNSIWNDNCEYDSLLDVDSKVDFEGKGGTIAQLKPMMSLLMCKIANDAVKEHDKDARPYVVCRSGSAGIQKYAQTWCGDNHTDWDSLKYGVPIITGMGLSGQPNEGADIGGFAGPAPEEELFVRWVQNGVFQPRFSIHSASNDNTVTEPWMYRNSTDLIRDAILMRYRFIPYLYSLEYESTTNGAPIMRPLVYEFQNDEKVYDESFEFLFGRDILVANVLEKGQTEKSIYLPAGCMWYDMNDNFRAYEGGQTITIPVDMSSIPMFLREGAIVPMALNQPMSMEKDKVTGLHLIMAPGSERTFTLYDDDGVTNRFKDGDFKKTTITMSGTSVVKVNFHSEGAFEDALENVKLELIRKDRAPYWITVGGEKLPHFLNRKQFDAAETGWYYSMTKKAVEIKTAAPKSDCEYVVSFEDFDLIGM